MFSETDYLRQQAQRCRRLARAVNDPDVVAELERLAQEMEVRAAALDAGTSREKR